MFARTSQSSRDSATRTDSPALTAVGRWVRRLATVAVLAPLGVAAVATPAPAPKLAAARLSDEAARPVVVDDEALVATLKHASVPSGHEASARFGVGTGPVPGPALSAYRFAEAVMHRADPGCNLDWSLLAAIGDVESDHGRFGGAVVRGDGTSSPQILGPLLDGSGGVAAIADTDQGALDHHRRWDRAVGPMQFIPSTWEVVGSDADDDGVRNPHDIDDAALAAAAYLCAGPGDLSAVADRRSAVYGYNPSWAYVDLVLRLAALYAAGDVPLLPADPVTTPVEVPVLPAEVIAPAHPRRAPAPGEVRAVRRAELDGAGRAGRVARDDSAATGTSGSGAGSSRTRASGGSAVDGAGATSRDGSSGSDTTRDGSSGGDRTSRDGSEAGGTDGGSAEGGSTDGDGTGGGSSSGDSPSADSGTGDSGSGGSGSGGSGTGDSGTGDSGSGDSGTGEEEPATETVDGVLDRAADGSWSVGATTVDFGDAAYLDRQALYDFDGSDGVESNVGELETLVGHEVSVVVEADGNVVRDLNGQTYRDADSAG